jgi:cytochrome c oxidase subunit 3
LATNQAVIVDRHEQDPALLHHFASKEQQKNSASLGMWLFLAQEVMFFGGMFCAYLVYRYKYFGDFASASQRLDVVYGTVNTAVLLCSSLTVVLSVRAAQLNKRKALTGWLILTILLGLVFLGVKGVEYHDKWVHHEVPGSSFSYEGTVPGHPNVPVDARHAEIYFSLYFAMTGMHALHMIVGVGLFSMLAWWAWHGKYNSNYYTPIENSGLYWHFVDIIWIYLFPLLYLIDRKK